MAKWKQKHHKVFHNITQWPLHMSPAMSVMRNCSTPDIHEFAAAVVLGCVCQNYCLLLELISAVQCIFFAYKNGLWDCTRDGFPDVWFSLRSKDLCTISRLKLPHCIKIIIPTTNTNNSSLH